MSVQYVQQVNDPRVSTWLQRHAVQAVIVAALGEKVDSDTMTASGAQWFNAHPSLLPFYRGGNPYSAVVRDGCEETGVTLHEMTTVWDWGQVWAQRHIPLNSTSETGGSVQLACAQHLPQLITEFLVNLSQQTRPTLWLPEILPPSHHAAWAPSLREQDRLLDPFQESAQTIERRLRAISPWAQGVFPPGTVSLDEWTVIQKADLHPGGPYQLAVPCANATTLYVRQCTFWRGHE